MTRHRRRPPRATGAVAAAALVAALAGCAGDGGDAVTVLGPEVDAERESLEESFRAFTEETGIEVDVQGSRDFNAEIGPRLRGGTAPDIALFPQPGRVGELAEDIVALPDQVVSEVGENFDAGYTDLVTFDGELKAVPAKADLKSLVWYSPQAFAAAGYTVPETFDDFLALSEQMAADGNTPFCVGIESGDASGWPLTDWVEDFMLRLEGPELYDRWHRHEIPFDHPDVVAVGETVADLWSGAGFVYGGTDAAAATSFADAGLPLLEGECMMMRQGNFYVAHWPDGVELGAEGDVAAFYLPGSEEHPHVTLTGGLYAAAFSEDEDVMRVMEFLASTDYANARAGNEIGGYLSPNRNTDVARYPDEITRRFGEILAAAEPVRFDASDLMPGSIGSGAFWIAAEDIVTGSEDVATAFGQIEQRWRQLE